MDPPTCALILRSHFALAQRALGSKNLACEVQQEDVGETWGGVGSVSGSKAILFFLETGAFFPCMLREVLLLHAESQPGVLALVLQRLDAPGREHGQLGNESGLMVSWHDCGGSEIYDVLLA